MNISFDRDGVSEIGLICFETTVIRPGGTGSVGPAMAGPSFELCRIVFKIQNKTVNFLEPKVYTIKSRPLLIGK